MKLVDIFISYFLISTTFLGLTLIIRLVINYKSLFQKKLEKEGLFDLLTKDGTSKNVIPGSYGEFGIEITNPVPIYTHIELGDYLNNLLSINGESITHKRIGSNVVSNIQNPIDIYDIYINDVFYKKLYLCPYHKKTSKKIPKGFKVKYNEHNNKDFLPVFLAMLVVQIAFTFFLLFILDIEILEYFIFLIINSFCLPLLFPSLFRNS